MNKQLAKSSRTFHVIERMPNIKWIWIHVWHTKQVKPYYSVAFWNGDIRAISVTRYISIKWNAFAKRNKFRNEHSCTTEFELNVTVVGVAAHHVTASRSQWLHCRQYGWLSTELRQFGHTISHQCSAEKVILHRRVALEESSKQWRSIARRQSLPERRWHWQQIQRWSAWIHVQPRRWNLKVSNDFDIYIQHIENVTAETQPLDELGSRKMWSRRRFGSPHHIHLILRSSEWITSVTFRNRSESPSSQRSSPPISPGCEDQMLEHDTFKKPLPPMRPQEFPPFYGGYPYHLIQHGSSAFHRPMDASGKPMPVSGKRHFLSQMSKHVPILCKSICQLNLFTRATTNKLFARLKSRNFIVR